MHQAWAARCSRAWGFAAAQRRSPGLNPDSVLQSLNLLTSGQCFLVHPAYQNPLRHLKKYYSRSNVSFPSSLRTNKHACKTHHLPAPFPVFSPLSSHDVPAGHLCYHPPGRREPRQRTGVDERGVEQWALKFNNSKNALFLWLSVA